MNPGWTDVCRRLMMASLVLSLGLTSRVEGQSGTVLVSRLADENVTIRMEAFYLLLDGGRLPGTEATQAVLIDLLAREMLYEHEPGPVNESWPTYFADLVYVVASLNTATAIPQLLELIDRGAIVTDTLARLGPSALDSVISRMSSTDARKALGAAIVLSRMLDPDNVARVSDEPSRTKINAALVLASRSLTGQAGEVAREALTKLNGPASPFTLGLNRADFTSGSTLTLTATLRAFSPARTVDAYVVARLPTGAYLSLQLDGRLLPGLVPIARSLVAFDFAATLTSYTFTGAEPRGQYAWLAALTEPGTLVPISSIQEASFSVR